MQPGRNEPCPCGSGRKYKVCCLGNLRSFAPVQGVYGQSPHHASDFPSPAAVRAVELRRLQDALEPKMMAWARRELGQNTLRAAWEDFTLRRYAIEPEGAEFGLFQPWLIYNWRTRPSGSRRRNADPGNDLCIAELFTRWRAAEVSTAERTFLQAVVAEPFSFHDVEDCEPGRSLRLRDILRGTRREVVEVSGSQGPRRGDLIFCRAVPFEGVCLLIGSGDLILPPMEKEPILELRKSLKGEFGDIRSDLLHVLDDRLREIYFMTRDHILNPPAPKLCNTDGDPLLFHEITYEIASPDAAFHALRSLAVGRSVEELHSQARLDRSGGVKKIEFPWVKSGNKMNPALDNTILGHIRIDGRSLKVEVNSERRARRIMSEIRKRLKGSAIHLETRAKSAEAALRARKDDGPRPVGGPRADKGADLRRSPEVQAAIRSMLDAHWRTWPEHPLPALGGKTPLDAVKDPEGREMVEALLITAERREQENPQAGQPFDFTPIRRRLGLK